MQLHNCKIARDDFIDLALDELSPASAKQLLAELNVCASCREEFATLRSTLHVSGQALRSGLPAESFWPGYHDRLRNSLLLRSTQEREARPRTIAPAHDGSGWLALKAILTTSIRVPVPAIAAVLVLFVMTLVGVRSFGQVNAVPPALLTTVETKIVTVPVFEEKVITRVVYAPGKPGRPRRSGLDRNVNPNLGNRVASAAQTGSSRSPLSLVGFEPTDRVKLTVIKGSYRDEK